MERAPEVLRVKPAPDRQDGAMDVTQVVWEIARLPVFVVGAVLHELLPEGIRLVEILARE